MNNTSTQASGIYASEPTQADAIADCNPGRTCHNSPHSLSNVKLYWHSLKTSLQCSKAVLLIARRSSRHSAGCSMRQINSIILDPCWQSVPELWKGDSGNIPATAPLDRHRICCPSQIAFVVYCKSLSCSPDILRHYKASLYCHSSLNLQAVSSASLMYRIVSIKISIRKRVYLSPILSSCHQ